MFHVPVVQLLAFGAMTTPPFAADIEAGAAAGAEAEEEVDVEVEVEVEVVSPPADEKIKTRRISTDTHKQIMGIVCFHLDSSSTSPAYLLFSFSAALFMFILFRISMEMLTAISST